MEEKNIFRQNFCEAEIGTNKAETLARRYGTAWGLEIIALPVPFSADTMYRKNLGDRYGGSSMPVFITCVDKNSPRQDVAKACSQYFGWWLDCGNVKTAGQVSIGRGLPPLVILAPSQSKGKMERWIASMALRKLANSFAGWIFHLLRLHLMQRSKENKQGVKNV